MALILQTSSAEPGAAEQNVTLPILLRAVRKGVRGKQQQSPYLGGDTEKALK